MMRTWAGAQKRRARLGEQCLKAPQSPPVIPSATQGKSSTVADSATSVAATVAK